MRITGVGNGALLAGSPVAKGGSIWPCSEVGQSPLGRRLVALISERRCLAASRRRSDPRVRFVARRAGGGGAKASRSKSASRCRARARFRNWARCSDASTMRTVPESRCSRFFIARRRCDSLSTLTRARSTDNCTLLSVVLIPCPPGPDDRANCSVRSAAGIVRPFGIPGPGSMVSASMCRFQALHFWQGKSSLGRAPIQRSRVMTHGICLPSTGDRWALHDLDGIAYMQVQVRVLSEHVNSGVVRRRFN